MTRFRDLTGTKNVMATAIRVVDRRGARGYIFWEFKCDCGNVFVRRGSQFTSGQVRSCGCLRRKELSELARKRSTKHGLYKTRLYAIWRGMKNRCYVPNNSSYKRYGGRGISVCVEWKDDFLAFYKWATSHGYIEGLSIDRIDPDGNYTPSNCQWLSRRDNTLKMLKDNKDKKVYKICLVCKATFFMKSSNDKYCCKRCCDIAQNEKKRERRRCRRKTN